MYDDFKMIVHQFPKEWNHINLYPLADLHVGSKEFDADAFRRWKEIVRKDPYGLIVTAGNLSLIKL